MESLYLFEEKTILEKLRRVFSLRVNNPSIILSDIDLEQCKIIVSTIIEKINNLTTISKEEQINYLENDILFELEKIDLLIDNSEYASYFRLAPQIENNNEEELFNELIRYKADLQFISYSTDELLKTIKESQIIEFLKKLFEDSEINISFYINLLYHYKKYKSYDNIKQNIIEELTTI